MMKKYDGATKGPWKIGEWDDDSDAFLRKCTLIESPAAKEKYRAGDVCYVATIREDNRTTPEQDSNARLIADAPRLAELCEKLAGALRAIVDLDDGDQPDLWHFELEFSNARAALAEFDKFAEE